MVKNYIEVDGVRFIKESELKVEAPSKDGLTLCMLRTYSAGVWFGYIDYEAENYLNCEVLEASRFWKWEGAFTISALAVDGTTKPSDCRLAVEVPKLKLNRVIEIIPLTEKALETFKQITRG